MLWSNKKLQTVGTITLVWAYISLYKMCNGNLNCRMCNHGELTANFPTVQLCENELQKKGIFEPVKINPREYINQPVPGYTDIS